MRQDAELFEQGEERAGERRMSRALTNHLPVDLLAQRARVLEQWFEREVVLAQDEQSSDEQVVERHHEHRNRLDVHHLAAREERVVEREAPWGEDEIDQ